MKFKIHHLRFIIFLALFQLIAAASFSQEIEIETIEGRKCYIHRVEAGNTLYGISKKYMVNPEEILQYNPEAKSGLKPGQVLKIPISKENKKLEKANAPDLEGKYILHTVEKGQTLYSLSKLYNVEIKDIVAENEGIQNNMPVGMVVKIPSTKTKINNPQIIIPAGADVFLYHTVKKGETLYGISKIYNVDTGRISAANKGFPEGLKEGAKIAIPLKTKEARDSIYDYIKERLTTDVDSGKKESYNIALLLPFHLDANDTLAARAKEGDKEQLPDESLIGLHFYEGFLLGLDRLKKRGASFKIYTYDTQGDSNQVKELLLKPELKEMDLIIGPFYMSSFNVISQFAKQNKIHLVSPFTQTPLILKDNPFVNKVTPSLEKQVEQLAFYLSEKHPNDSIVLVNNYSEKDKSLINTFVVKGNELLPPGNPVKDVPYNTAGTEGLLTRIDSTKTNIVVVLSSSQAFITDFITKFYFAKPKNVTLFSLENLLTYENIDPEYLQYFNTHVAASGFIDYEDEKVISFVRAFRNRYKTEPLVYAFKGYDIATFYLNALFNYGSNLLNLHEIKEEGLQGGFSFSREGDESGLENEHISIIKFGDYKLVKIK